mmetsp:Transcript_85415/g.237670  ORF Transcript_85415/g.237670 Transcript_85415/m.237670 type:complete len:240 (+) Transcript_85415:79-798(+)
MASGRAPPSLRLLGPSPVPGPLVQNGRLHHHLQRQERRHHRPDDGHHKRVQRLVGDHLACHQLLLHAQVLDRVSCAEAPQEGPQDLHRRCADCLVTQDVHLGAAGCQEGLDAAHNADDHRDEKEHQHEMLGQEDHRPEEEVAVRAAGEATSACGPARAQLLPEGLRGLVELLLLRGGLRAVKVTGRPKPIKEHSECRDREEHEVRHPHGPVEGRNLVKERGRLEAQHGHDGVQGVCDGG